MRDMPVCATPHHAPHTLLRPLFPPPKKLNAKPPLLHTLAPPVLEAVCQKCREHKWEVNGVAPVESSRS